MGTMLEYATNWRVNPPISSRSSSNKITTSSSFSCVNDRAIRKKEYLAGDQMDENEIIQNMEIIKKTMQMHEDVFKQQVRELHRLYYVQKTLMGEVKKQNEQSRIWSPPSRITSTVTSKNSTYMSHQALPCSLNHRIPRDSDLERRPVKGDISGYQREVGSPSWSMEEHEVELTLSMGGKMISRMKPRIDADAEKKSVSSLSLESNSNLSYPAPENGGSTKTRDLGRKQPRWLLHL
ncbi:hypothetical protein SAY86_009573 [Trapa natans]|uniref:Uncharacterized protein n=1 Tax=Trapa natans TaxID=22666 RepID=A0AAN7L1X3_TRANT|nr:hypothetical protein SAY86_009573 [Trapa natans]